MVNLYNNLQNDVEKRQWVKHSFYSTIIRDLMRVLDLAPSGVNIPSVILALCCIDYMGVPLAGNNDNNGGHFKQFVKEYMFAGNSKYSENQVIEFIWAIRCSLIHTYGESKRTKINNLKPSYELGAYRDTHLLSTTEDGNKTVLIISIPDFVAEVIVGVEKFFRDFPDMGILSEWYINTIQNVGIDGMMEKMALVDAMKQNKIFDFSEIHPFLASISDPNKTYLEIKQSIVDLFNKKYNFQSN